MPHRPWFRSSVALAAAALLLACTACRTAQPVVLTVSVAASLTDAIEAAEAAYTHAHPGIEFRNNFGASGTLAQQIALGAPVDIFLSAAEEPMSDLATRNLLVPRSRRDLLRNTLVLIAPLNSTLAGFDQLASVAVRNLAIGDPGHVPAGRYAQQSLTALHLLPALQPRLVLAENVRQVLTYVETGNADAGLVYATDAAISDKVRVVATAPDSTHEPIVYPVAVLRASAHPDAASDFVAYLASPAARDFFTQRGFTMAAQ
ncbi:MAG: molybdate ABC transporter substrate-binding protein [Terracidiphilus sp.]